MKKSDKTNSNEILNEVSAGIAAWISQNNSTLSEFSRQANLTISTARRIYFRERLPNAGSLLKAAMTIAGSRNTSDVENKFSPELVSYLQSELATLDFGSKKSNLTDEEKIVLNEVTSKIQDWQTQAKSNTLRELGNLAKTSELVIEGILTYRSLPHPQNLLRILGAMIGSNKISDLRKNYSEQLISYLKFRLPMLDFERHEPSAVENFGANEMLDIDRTLFEVYLFIVTLETTSRSELVREFGDCALKWVDLLIDKKLAYETIDNLVFPKQKDVEFSKSKVELKRILETVLDNRYKPSAEYNCIAFTADPVSEVGYKKMRDAIRDFMGNLEKIATEHPGSIPVVTGLFTDILQESKRASLQQKDKIDGD